MAEALKNGELKLENDSKTEGEDVVVGETAEKPDEIVVEQETAAPEGVKDASVSEEDAVIQLRKQLDEERLARVEAEKRAQEAAQRAQSASKETETTHLQLVNQAIDQFKRENDILKSNLRAAMSENDYDKAAELQEAMAMNAARLLQLEQGKQAMEQRVKNPPPPEGQDLVESFASRLTPKSADWVRKNPQYVTDPRLNRRMIAAHELAVSDNIAVDTPEYFAFVEKTLGIQKPEARAETSALSEASAPTKARSAPPSAPVSRSGTGTGTRSNVVRLTSAEAEMADMMGMTHKEYATHKLALQKAGKLPN